MGAPSGSSAEMAAEGAILNPRTNSSGSSSNKNGGVGASSGSSAEIAAEKACTGRF